MDKKIKKQWLKVFPEETKPVAEEVLKKIEKIEKEQKEFEERFKIAKEGRKYRII